MMEAGPGQSSSLPERIIWWIRHDGGDQALLMISVDGGLRPHVMMLARDEVAVMTPSRLRVAVGEASRSAENLRTRSVATLAVYDEGLAGVIKTHVISGPAPLVPGVAVFELGVDDVRLDTPSPGEGAARLVTGLRFEGRTSREDVQAQLARIPPPSKS